MGNNNCIFCKITKGEIPSHKIYEDKVVLAFLDINPVHVGHALVIPKKHFDDLHHLPIKTAEHIIKIAQKISKALMKMGADGTNISMNNGEHAGQTVFHSHTHVMPRFKKDGLKHDWPKKNPEKKEIEKMAKKIIAEL